MSACGETVSRTKLEIYCPPLKEYTPEYNEQLAQEIERLPGADTYIEQTIVDYIDLRDDIRLCAEIRDRS